MDSYDHLMLINEDDIVGVGLYMPHEEDAVVDAGGQLFLVVGHHDEGLVATAAEGLDDIFNQATIAVVKTMEWFVEDKELWVLYECPCHENQALLTA